MGLYTVVFDLQSSIVPFIDLLRVLVISYIIIVALPRGAL